ncbi:MaoC family dehydratase [Salmonella enterica subsp. enterica]|nr:MaoC family dehydratase [Salmonella enterica subsp. enterica serovar Enteritidis]
MADFIGQELGVSGWMTVDQKMIDEFAETTGDRQWIHIDVEKAKKYSPFGGTIAHGYLTLSLIAPLSYEIGAMPEGMAAVFNYGMDKMRFLTPVRAGSKVRLRSTLMGFDPKGGGQYLMKSNNVIEIEGQDKPALIAEVLAMLVQAPGKA